MGSARAKFRLKVKSLFPNYKKNLLFVKQECITDFQGDKNCETLS